MSLSQIWASYTDSVLQPILETDGAGGYQYAITFTVRYRDDLVIDSGGSPVQILDDLGRVWGIQDRRVIGERQFVELDCFHVGRRAIMPASLRIRVDVEFEQLDYGRLAERFAFYIFEDMKRDMPKLRRIMPRRTGRLQDAFDIRYDKAKASVTVGFKPSGFYYGLVHGGRPKRELVAELTRIFRKSAPSAFSKAIREQLALVQRPTIRLGLRL